MAEKNKKTAPRAQAAGSARKAPSPRADGDDRPRRPARDNTPPPDKEPRARRDGPGTPPPPPDAAPSRAHRFSEQYMPYIWGAIGLFFAVCFILDVIGGAEVPDDHLMGVVGFWLCRCLFGLFGWAAFLLPVLFFSLTAFWRKYCREHLVGVQVLMSMLFLLLLSAFIHVCACSFTYPELGEITDARALFNTGYEFSGGGVIGGWVGWVLYHGLKFAGSLVLMIVTMPLVVMFLIGVTPAYVFARIKRKIKASRAERRAAAEAAAAAAAEHEAEEAARRKEQEKEAASRKKSARTAPAAEEETENGADGSADNGEDDAEYTPPAKTPRAVRHGTVPPPAADEDRTAAEARAIWLDPVTGEVLKDHGMEKPAAQEPAETDEILPADVPAPGIASEEEEPLPDDGVNTPGESRARRARHVTVSLDDPDTVEAESPDAAAGDEESAPDGDFIPMPGEGESALPDDEETEEDAELIDAEPDAGTSDEDPFADVPGLSLPRSGRGPGGEIVVHVLKQETAALTDTPGNQIGGLPDEQTSDADADAPDTAAAAAAEVPDGPVYVFPPIDSLMAGSNRYEADEEEIARNIRTLQDTLESFHIRIKDISCSVGPTVTRYEVKPDSGVRVRSIANLVDDISLSLAKGGVRIEAPIPNKPAVGIEVPNDKLCTVYLRNLIETPEFQTHKSRIAACLGAEVSGQPVIFDINKMPHLLVAGTTGSGKSVCINCIIMSILYKSTPDEVKLILIDPKKVEFTVYRDLPHLYCPIVTDPKKAAGALYSAVTEMERRYELFEEVGARNLAGYNKLTSTDPGKPVLPQMVIIIDELADLMLTAPADVETAICRLAQKARAAGIHLILGTQRPSVDVITGLIKANIPSRIAFTVKSQIDSRTIIDMSGAENLIGRGDMLYAPVGSTKPIRVQGAFVSDEEVERVVGFILANNGKAVYDEEFARQIDMEAARCGSKKKGGDEGNIEDFDALGGGGDEDPKFWEAVEVAIDNDKVSTSLLQRTLKLGYGRAAKIIDRMEEKGIVGPADGNKPRRILITAEKLAELRHGG